MVLDIILAHKVANDQAQLSQAQQIYSQGQQVQQNLRALLTRISADLQKTGDQGIKDLLARQQISLTPPAASTNSTDNPSAPAPSSH